MTLMLFPPGTLCKIAGGPVGTITCFAVWGKGSVTYELTYVDEQSVARNETYSSLVIAPVNPVPASAMVKVDIPDATAPQAAKS